MTSESLLADPWSEPWSDSAGRVWVRAVPHGWIRATCCNCGSERVFWNMTGGWGCRGCGEADYPEAAS